MSAHPAHPAPESSIGDSSRAESTDPALDISVFKVLAQRALVDALNSVNGAKTLVLDPTLSGPLSLVTEVSLLKHHGVDKIFWLESGLLNATTTNVVYLCRPQIKWMKIIADQIKRLTQESTPHTYTIFLVPRRTSLCNRILEEEGVLGDVTISSYKLEFIPIEDDLLSLEWDNVWKEIYVDGDDTSIFYAAQALNTIQEAYGLFPRILGKGNAAKRLASLVTKSSSRNRSTSDILDSLVIIDRNVDMLTPLLTQLTYEGLLDEVFGIQNSHIKVDASLLSLAPTSAPTSAASPPPVASSPVPLPTTTTASTKKHHLTSADPIFAQLRNLNFAIVGMRLNREARRLGREYEVRHTAEITQLRDFVGRLGGLQNEHQALRLHTGLSEKIGEYTRTDLFNKGLEIQQNLLQGYETSAQVSSIEDLIAQHAPVDLVCRLLCLANLVTGGIKAKILDNLKREILQSYGYALTPLLLNLAPLSLLTPSPLPKPLTLSKAGLIISSKAPVAPPSFSSIRKSFRLLTDTPETDPTDISFVYSGYAPLSVRLVQCVVQKNGVLASANPGSGENGSSDTQGRSTDERIIPPAQPIKGWKGFEDAVNALPGETVDITPGSTTSATTEPNSQPTDNSTTTVVFFLGGCTYTEIAALRWVNSQMKGRKILIATTSIVNGSTLLQSLGDEHVQLINKP